MKRGNLRVHHDYKYDGWRIQGRKNGVWVNAQDEDRIQQGLHPELLFDYQYDACAYLKGYIDWIKDNQSIPTQPTLLTGVDNEKTSNINVDDYLRQKKINKKKRKMARASRRANR